MPLAAFVPKQEGARDALRIDPPRIAARGERIDPSSATPAGAAATGFLQRYGGEWRFSADSRTARFDLILGTGIPLIPGRGNDLGPAALESLDLPDGEITLGALEPRIREFLETNAALVVPERGTLVLNGTASQLRLGGRLISFSYDWHVDGIPVDGARVFVRVNSGNITQIGAPLVGAIGSLQAMEALKVLTGFGEPLRGKLLVADLRSMEFRRLELSVRPDCPACSHLHI